MYKNVLEKLNNHVNEFLRRYFCLFLAFNLNSTRVESLYNMKREIQWLLSFRNAIMFTTSSLHLKNVFLIILILLILGMSDKFLENSLHKLHSSKQNPLLMSRTSSKHLSKLRYFNDFWETSSRNPLHCEYF